MYLTKEEREELSTLSKEVFGTRSRWQKMITDGEREKIAPQQYVTRFHTAESAKEFMLNIKKQRDEIMATIQKQNEEARAKAEQEKLLKEVNKDSGGSAL